MRLVTANDVELAHELQERHRLDMGDRAIVLKTPLILNQRLSGFVGGDIVLKNETAQLVMSYKIRGAFNAISLLNTENTGEKLPVVCASAGNHAQGIALTCSHTGNKGVIFMPVGTADVKQSKTREFGGENVEIRIEGENFDECKKLALQFAQRVGACFIDPFDDYRVQAGQGTIAYELMHDTTELGKRVRNKLRYLFLPVGGGGLGAGIIAWLKERHPTIDIFGVEQIGSDSMRTSLAQNGRVALETVDKFADGAAVGLPGTSTYAIFQKYGVKILQVSKNRLAVSVDSLLREDGMTVETAGGLSVAALGGIREQLAHTMSCCILSGGNIDSSKQREVAIRKKLYYSRKRKYVIDKNINVTGDLDGHEDIITYLDYANGRGTSFQLQAKQADGYLYLEAFESKLIKRGIKFTIEYQDVDLSEADRHYGGTIKGPVIFNKV